MYSMYENIGPQSSHFCVMSLHKNIVKNGHITQQGYIF
jgi:hypothetical protein